MGLTKEQRIGGICNDVSWLRWRDRLKVLWALMTAYAKNEQGKREYW